MELVKKNSDSIRLSDVLLGRHFGLLLLTNFAAVGLGMVDLGLSACPLGHLLLIELTNVVLQRESPNQRGNHGNQTGRVDFADKLEFGIGLHPICRLNIYPEMRSSSGHHRIRRVSNHYYA
jgi:hypothetical protein